MFQYRHYEWLARFLRCDSGIADSADWTEMVNQLTRRLALDNPKFNEVRFLKACGVE